MTRIPPLQFAHLGIHVFDLEKMLAFYTGVLGFVQTDSGEYYRGGRIVFLSANPHEHHQIVLASGRVPGSPTLINQISFKVTDLASLKQTYEAIRAARLDDIAPRNHGNAWSIYFPDPEGNRIEIYATAPWYVRQPGFGRPLDMTKSVDEILELTYAQVKDDPTYKPIEQWSAELAQRLQR